MDGMESIYADCERLAQQKLPTNRRYGKRRTSKPADERRSGNRPERPQERFAPLVIEDRLFFRLLAYSDRPDASEKPQAVPEPQTTSVGKAFQSVFRHVWASIPEADRACMVNYWQSDRLRLLFPELARAPHPKPLIQIVNLGSRSSSFPFEEAHGHVLNFPAPLIAQGDCHASIVRALAAACLHASGTDSDLWFRIAEIPWQRWEKRHGSNVTEEELDRKYQQFADKFLRERANHQDQLIQKWNVPEPQVAAQESSAVERGICNR